MDGNATAVGVRFVSTPAENGTVGGPVSEVAATREVIVASGAIGVRLVPFSTEQATDHDSFLLLSESALS